MSWHGDISSWLKRYWFARDANVENFIETWFEFCMILHAFLFFEIYRMFEKHRALSRDKQYYLCRICSREKMCSVWNVPYIQINCDSEFNLVIRDNLNTHYTTKVQISWNNPLFKEKFIFLNCRVNTINWFVDTDEFTLLFSIAIRSQPETKRISAEGDLYWSFICIL